MSEMFLSFELRRRDLTLIYTLVLKVDDKVQSVNPLSDSPELFILAYRPNRLIGTIKYRGILLL